MLLVLLSLAVVCLLLACGGVIRDNPRPGTGAATPEELATAYRQAHEQNDLEQLTPIDLTLTMLPERLPMNGEYKSAMEGVFRLILEDVRVVREPANAATQWDLAYLCRKPNGEPRVSLIGARMKLILSGRRPDGGQVEVDPGFGVFESDGRFYLKVEHFVAGQAAQAIANGAAPSYRAIPPGVGFRFVIKELDQKDWHRANRQLDEVEQRIRAGGPPPP
jgi:hypothetical protein